MSNDPTFRGDPSVKWALKQGISPWDIMLVNCPNPFCAAHNYFIENITQECRLCGTKIADRADEQYSVGAAMEMVIERARQQAFGEIEEIFEMPYVPDEKEVPQAPPGADARDQAHYAAGNRFLTLIWILMCIGVVAVLAALSHCGIAKL